MIRDNFFVFGSALFYSALFDDVVTMICRLRHKQICQQSRVLGVNLVNQIVKGIAKKSNTRLRNTELRSAKM